MDGQFVRGSTCLFRAPKSFVYTALGHWKRRVYGVAGWKWAIVGQGGRGIEKTAYAHEMSHVHLNQHDNEMISEKEAHDIFKEVGV